MPACYRGALTREKIVFEIVLGLDWKVGQTSFKIERYPQEPHFRATFRFCNIFSYFPSEKLVMHSFKYTGGISLCEGQQLNSIGGSSEWQARLRKHWIGP